LVPLDGLSGVRSCIGTTAKRLTPSLFPADSQRITNPGVTPLSKVGNFPWPARIGYYIPLRRLCAVLLLAVFSLGLMAPAFAADADAYLPSCCRRAGKHHCSMTAEPAAGLQDGPVIGLHAVCPLYGHLGAVRANSSKTLLPAVASFRIPQLMNAARERRSRPVFPISPAHVHFQRGPPSFLFLG